MAIDVGAVFVRLGWRQDDKELHNWERNVVRAQQVKDIKVDLGANFDERGFHVYDDALAKARAKSKERDAFKARLGADFDPRAFNAYYRELQKAQRETAAAEHKMTQDRQEAEVERQKQADNEKRRISEMTIGMRLAARVFGESSSAFKGLEGIFGGGGAGGAGGGGIAASLGGLRGALGPLAGVAASLLPLLVALGGAAVALAGSFAAAAAGAAAVGVGFGAALGPLAAIAAVMMQRVGLLTAAFSALDTQQTKSGVSAKSQADAQAAAAQQVKGAEQGLADAQRQVVQAQDALTVARFRARREVIDLGVALDRTNLSEQRANLSLEQATRHLAEVQADPQATNFDLRDATLAVKEAREALKEARTERNRAVTDAKRGTDTVRVAEGQLADARRGAARAADQVAQAQQAASKATEKQSGAANSANEALSKLTRTERGLLTTVRHTLDAVQKTFQPATDAIFGGVDRALQTLTPVMERFRGRFKGIGEAVSGVIDTASKSLAGPEWTRALDAFAVTARRIVKPIGDTMGSVGVILRNIAVAAQPFVRELAGEVARFFGGLAGQTNDAARMRDIIGKLVEHTKAWAHFGAAVARLLFTIFNSGARDGKSLVETMTGMVDRWAKFLATREGQERMRKFFRDSIDALKGIGTAVLTLTPVVTTLVLKLIELAAWFGNHKTELAIFAGALVAIGVAFGGPVVQIGLLTSAIILAYEKSRTFREVVSEVFQTVRRIIGKDINFILGLLSGFLGGLSSVESGLTWLPGLGGRFRREARGIDDARASIDRLRDGIRAATDPMGEFSKAADQMHRRTYKSFSDLRKEVSDQVGRIKSATLDGSEKSRQALSDNFRVAAAAVERSTQRMGGSTQDAMKRIRTLMVDALHAYGLKAEDAAKLFPDYRQRLAAGLTSGPPSYQGGPATALGPKARGGWVGNPGAAGADTVSLDAPVGSAVLNRHQLPYAAMALAGLGAGLDDIGLNRSGGGMTAPITVGHGEFIVDPAAVGLLDGALGLSGMGGLDALFSSVTRPHYLARGGLVTGDTDYGAAMTRAMAGLAGAYGHPIFVQSGRRTLAEQAALVRSKGAYSASNPTGAAPPSANAPHVRGVAADITPGRSALAGLAGRFGLGFPLASEPWHIQLLSSLAGGGGAAAAVRRKLIAPVNVDSHSGVLTLIGQGASNLVRRGAQGLLDLAASGSAPSGETSPSGTTGKPAPAGRVRSWIEAGLRLAGVPATPGNVNIVYGRVMQESGGNPNIVNNWDSNAQRGDPSIGLLQTTSSTFRRYAVKGHGSIRNPVDNVAAAVRYMLATYGHLVGAGPGGYAKGGRVSARKTAGHGTAHGTGTHLKLLSTTVLPTDRIAAYDDLTGSLEDDRKLYEQADRRYGLTDEVLVNPDTGELDTVAIAQRAAELSDLLAIRQRILAKLRQAQALAQRIIASYRSIVKRLGASLKHAKKKDRSGIQGQLDQANEALGTWRKTAHDLGADVQDADLDVQDITGERAGVLGTLPGTDNRPKDVLTPDERAASDQVALAVSLAKLTPDTADDEAARAQGEAFWRGILARLQGSGAAPTDITTAADTLAGFLTQGQSPADIAASSIAAVGSYLSAQQQSLGAYSRNFVTPFQARSPGGVFSGSPDQLAALGGAKYLGATGDGGLGGAAGRSVVINNTYLNPPDNTQTWSSQMRYQIEAAVG